jgi:serine/threonine protein kinase
MEITAGTETEALRFLRELGHGGMGTVYLAEDRKLGKPCAVKVLHAHLAQDETARARFRNEVRAAAAVDHPAIVKTYAVDELPDGRPYCKMEYVEGPTLAEFCKRRREPLSLGLSLRIIGPICEAFEVLHALRIVHRDLKPDNVLIVERGGQVFPRVLDFSIAMHTDGPRLTSPGIAPGTAAYMAPEQVRGGTVDRACDVYALGVMMYWMATGGHLPYEVADAMMYFAQLNEPPGDPRSYGVPALAAGVLLTAIQPDAARRPRSMGSLALMWAQCVVSDGLQPDGTAILRECAPSLLVVGNLDQTLRSPGARSRPGSQAAVWKYDYGPVLGRGGMAEVVRATLRGEGQFAAPRAIKTILPEFAAAPEFEEAFREEARIAALLDHRNIVRVLEHDRDPMGRLYLAMELIEGIDLEKLRRSGPMPHAVTIFVLGEVLEALDFAHCLPPTSPLASPEEIAARGGARGIVHRDVSHHNVMISWLADVKLSDFGIAKLRTATSADGSQLIKGKPGYMSPEQASSQKKLDGRSDLWAIGVMLWELLTGEPLLNFDTFAATVYAIVCGYEIPKPSTQRPGVPSDLEEIAMRLLERDLTLRYQTAREVITALQACRSASRDGRGELARLLAERFPERAARAPAPCVAAQKVQGSPPDEPSSPGQRAFAVSTAEPASPWQAPTTTGHAHGQAVNRPARRARRWPWVAAALTSLTTGAVLVKLQRPHVVDSAGGGPVPSVEASPVPTSSRDMVAPPPAPSLVTVTIATEPSGAMVRVEAPNTPTSAQRAPLTVHVTRGTLLHLHAELEGFAPGRQDATIDHEGQTIAMALVPVDPLPSRDKTVKRSTAVPSSTAAPKPRAPARPASTSDDPGIIE